MSAPIKKGTSKSSTAAGGATAPGLRLTHVLPRARLLVLAAGLVLAIAAGIGAQLQPPRTDPLRAPEFSGPLAELWDFVRQPIERNAVFRLPRLGADLKAIAMAQDGQHGW